MVDNPLSFSERRKQLLEKRQREKGEYVEPWTDDEIIDVSSDSYPKDDELDAALASITITSAYAKWCGKSPIHAGSRTESIKVSCPLPGHADKDPSAWINTEKNVWMCGRCEQGGDVYDLAAIHYGYPIPGYKDGQTFHKLRVQMAEAFGYTVKKVAGGQVVYKDEEDEQGPEGQASESQPSNERDASEDVPPSEAVAEVTQLYAEEEEPELVTYPRVDWRTIVPADTFLAQYMEACTVDDAPEEYHFWHGLLALGHTAGRNVFLDDYKPVYGNLLVCLLGASGVGKSRSRGWLTHVMRTVLPYRTSGQDTSGTKLVVVPGSGEFLVREFSYEAVDPTNPKHTWYESVNGLVNFDELAAMIARTRRQGSSLQTTIMQMADAEEHISVGSLTHKTIMAERPFCSILATTQPKSIRTIINKHDAASGFLNRWIFAGGPPKRRESIGGARSGITVDLSLPIARLENVKGWAAMERTVMFADDAAYRTYDEFYHDIIVPAQQRDESELLKRLDLIIKKLILLFSINTKQTIVSAATVDAMVQLIEYIIDCYGLLAENIGVTANQEIIAEIMRHIRRHHERTKRGASARDLLMYMKRANYPPDQLKKALETMVALDMIELEKPTTKVGRPSIRYKAVGE